MHRLIQDHLEEILTGREFPSEHPVMQHLEACVKCLDIVSAMQEQQELFAAVRLAEPLEPSAGFYARVHEQIDAQRPAPSIWELFLESMVGRQMASVALASVMMMGVYLVSTENVQRQPQPGDQVVAATYPMLPSSDFPDEVLEVPGFASSAEMVAQAPGRDAVFLSLVTYQGR